MVIPLSRQENESKIKLIAAILCAGEGKRIQKDGIKVPKPLIKIPHLANKSILNITIDSLVALKFEKIIVVTGYSKEEVASHVSKIKECNSSLYQKVITINAGNEYKKGPLFSFFSIKDQIQYEQLIMVFPGDAIFDNDLLVDLMKYISSQHDDIIPTVFYREIYLRDLTNWQDSSKDEEKEITHLNTVKEKPNLLKSIEKGTFNSFKKDERINQIIPIFILDYDFFHIMKKFSEGLSFPSNSIEKLLNFISPHQKIQTIKIKSSGNFYDIDTNADLEHVIKKKGGQ